MSDMTSPGKIDHRIRLTPESSRAAKQAAHDEYLSFNAWVQKAVDFYLAHLVDVGEVAKLKAGG